MPIPLVWLGLGIGAVVASGQWQKAANRSQVQHYPGEIDVPVRPQNGAVVCCGIYGAFDHSGIWMEDGIIERAGNGLVRAISPARFIARRSGRTIFVACNEQGHVVTDATTGRRAAEQIYHYADYHLLNNNCHQFVASCLQDSPSRVTFFSQLNRILAGHYGSRISWHPAIIS
ncbi:hypothetical protein [Lacimicrobium alkaliphilum]|uniref:LRAT domain-containing protein n=1 Tax=Lacimicrobium alkaliphilum TaxID=1526571 RepID=A0ABQ1RKM3_9ALTE|nr:hypothetical protein [Lacimicrobium alkaliphilum]GGD73332.1 hypothetical protein GCM10011357_30520 [Lacimicrobium alkaliphilum]